VAAIDEIYEYEKVLKGVLHSLENSGICQASKALIEKFSRYLFAQGLSYGPYREVTNKLIMLINEEAYRRKEKLVKALSCSI